MPTPKNFGVRQAGLENAEFPTFEKQGQNYVNTGDTHKGVVEPIQKFETLEQAQANADDRNKRADEMNLPKVRYEAYAL